MDSGLLDTGRIGEALLVKVPIAVAKAWRAVIDAPPELDDKHSATLGTLVRKQQGAEQVSYVDLTGLQAEEGYPLPKRVKLTQVPAAPGDSSKTYVFSYAAVDGSNGKVVTSARVDGAVTQRMDLMPVMQAPNGEWVVDEEYRAAVSRRSLAASERVRLTQSHTETDQVANVEALRRVRNVRAQLGVKQKAREAEAKASEVKRSKMDPTELEALLFKLFDRQAAWPLKQLQAETVQPLQHLRTVLEGIAVQQRRGPNKDKYELKPEYRSSTRKGQATGQEEADM